jgi:hypothetical protein
MRHAALAMHPLELCACRNEKSEPVAWLALLHGVPCPTLELHVLFVDGDGLVFV